MLLHGGGGHARSWDTIASQLGNRHRVIALDQRGHGESGWASEYSNRLMANDVARFVTGLGLQEYDLVGHSMGGMNAIVLAAEASPGLCRLVIIDIGRDMVPHDWSPGPRSFGSHPTFTSPEAAVRAMREANPRANEGELRHRTPHNLVLAGPGERIWRHDRATGGTLPPDTNEELWAMWRSISAPTLLVRGELGRLLTADSVWRMVAEGAACKLVEIPGAGHSIPLEQPAALGAALESFLDTPESQHGR